MRTRIGSLHPGHHPWSAPIVTMAGMAMVRLRVAAACMGLWTPVGPLYRHPQYVACRVLFLRATRLRRPLTPLDAARVSFHCPVLVPVIVQPPVVGRNSRSRTSSGAGLGVGIDPAGMPSQVQTERALSPPLPPPAAQSSRRGRPAAASGSRTRDRGSVVCPCCDHQGLCAISLYAWLLQGRLGLRGWSPEVCCVVLLWLCCLALAVLLTVT